MCSLKAVTRSCILDALWLRVFYEMRLYNICTHLKVLFFSPVCFYASGINTRHFVCLLRCWSHFCIATNQLSPCCGTTNTSCHINLQPSDKLYLIQHVSQLRQGQRSPKPPCSYHAAFVVCNYVQRGLAGCWEAFEKIIVHLIVIAVSLSRFRPSAACPPTRRG